MKDKKDWKERVNDEVKLHGLLAEQFKDQGIIHRFSVNRLEPFGYATAPVIIDCNLFVNIERTNEASGETKEFRDVSLGSYCNEGPRELVAFGKEYFDSHYPMLIEIVRSKGQEWINERPRETAIKRTQIEDEGILESLLKYIGLEMKRVGGIK